MGARSKGVSRGSEGAEVDGSSTRALVAFSTVAGSDLRDRTEIPRDAQWSHVTPRGKRGRSSAERELVHRTAHAGCYVMTLREIASREGTAA